jgi:hypothetical protein
MKVDQNRVFLFGDTSPEQLGSLPYWLDPADKRPAKEQLDAHYQHGGGWRPFEGFKMTTGWGIKYPGDEPLEPIGFLRFRDEVVIFYPCSWVLILQDDKSFEICRMD